MKTVDKALSVLDQFSLSRTEIGLSELSRLAGLDKAATRRLLVAMARHGFIEQSAETRAYRLGHGFLRLARIREATVPMQQAAQEVATWLSGQTNETAHITLAGPASMTMIAYKLPNRGPVIYINPAENLPYHATASGLAYLAFAAPEDVDRILQMDRDRVASGTLTDEGEIRAALKDFRAAGHSRTRNSFEDDVASVAMPFFTGTGNPAGCVSLALPGKDMTKARRAALLPALKEAVTRLETALRGS